MLRVLACHASTPRVQKTLLNVRQQGAGKTACILIHGFADGAYVWNMFEYSICELFPTVAIELRGHGDSPWSSSGEYSIQRHLIDLLQVIDELCFERLVLVGHSLGGELAIHLARARPEKVAGLVLVDFGPDLNSAGVDRVVTDFRDSIRMWSSWSEYAMWLRTRRPLLSSAILDHLARNSLRAHPKGGYRIKCDPALGKVNHLQGRDAELWAILKRIVCPTLVIRGLESAVLPHAVARKMAQVLRKGSLRIVDRAGHAVMTDHPQGFAAALYPFLAQLRAEGGGSGGTHEVPCC